MSYNKAPKIEFWTGRKSEEELYLHEKVEFSDSITKKEGITALLGYLCDEGVKRNQGREGAVAGADAIRAQLAKMPNHLEKNASLIDYGDITCIDGNMEESQAVLAQKVTELLKYKALPILLGGGHDIAYGHYNGIREYLGIQKSIGIINFDAHFDLRSNKNGNNSGTPFFQIAEDCQKSNTSFNYLCLGIRKDANDKNLFRTAKKLGVGFIENKKFSMDNAKSIADELLDFLGKVDHVYVTIDLDGFSSAYAPGVSAPSPMGFSPKIVLESLELILKSDKLISMDIAEMNPKYDIDNQTAKLGASLIHYVMHSKF
ncbi:formimidoylglutamase [Maribacter sp. HTCC2170]|uniref:formimidoylglutamase n=1 Tax=Maribacter sp. (strain HTCC2170 / KCCM 42371) TaxID=313603 RepID=UPI00006BD57C|nr:formimidoylglutamase [Maribacter sp. HTCC2170]EAR02347.1 formiminoglutamase [Maribacter sp. HTCC2170]